MGILGKFLAMVGGVGIAKLVGDVDEDGGTARGDAPLGYQVKEPGEKLFQLHGGGPLGGQAEEFGREILGIVMRFLAREIGKGVLGEVTETEAALRVRAGEAAALAIGEEMATA